jgi:hypothetical protein
MQELCLLRYPLEVETDYASSLVGGTIQSVFNLWRRRNIQELAWVIRDGISQSEVESALSGWEATVSKPDSLVWLIGRFLV